MALNTFNLSGRLRPADPALPRRPEGTPCGARSLMTDPPGPTDTGVLGPPPPGATSASARPGAVRPHILVVNGRKVRQPVFVFGAPCSGVTILARALKRAVGRFPRP